jgi:hypothetical protein
VGAVWWKPAGAPYVFAADRYWRLNASGDAPLPGYPKPITEWGLPADVSFTSVFSAASAGPRSAEVGWGNDLYFAAGQEVWRVGQTAEGGLDTAIRGGGRYPAKWEDEFGLATVRW